MSALEDCTGEVELLEPSPYLQVMGYFHDTDDMDDVIGYLDGTETNGIDAWITYERRLGKFACAASLHFPQDLAAEASAIFNEIKQLGTQHKPGGLSFGAHNLMLQSDARHTRTPMFSVHLHGTHTDNSTPTLTVAGKHEVTKLGIGAFEPDLLDSTIRSPIATVVRLSQFVGMCINVILEHTASPKQATLGVTLPHSQIIDNRAANDGRASIDTRAEVFGKLVYGNREHFEVFDQLHNPSHIDIGALAEASQGMTTVAIRDMIATLLEGKALSAPGTSAYMQPITQGELLHLIDLYRRANGLN